MPTERTKRIISSIRTKLRLLAEIDEKKLLDPEIINEMNDAVRHLATEIRLIKQFSIYLSQDVEDYSLPEGLQKITSIQAPAELTSQANFEVVSHTEWDNAIKRIGSSKYLTTVKNGKLLINPTIPEALNNVEIKVTGAFDSLSTNIYEDDEAEMQVEPKYDKAIEYYTLFQFTAQETYYRFFLSEVERLKTKENDFGQHIQINRTW